MDQMQQRAYRFRFYPTKSQIEYFAKAFGCCRFVYNHFLEEKKTLWDNEKIALSYTECSKRLRSLKEKFSWLSEVSSVVLQQSLRHLQTAYDNFFKKKAKYPRFKKKLKKQSASYMKNGFLYKKKQLFLAKLKEPLNIVITREFFGEPTSITITKESSGRYFISILVKETIKKHPFVKKEVGIDLGIKTLVTDSFGEKNDSILPLKKELKTLRRTQKSLSRKQKNSNNRKKQACIVAKLNAKIKDTRHDNLHKLSSQYVRENQVIVVEDLQIKNMIKNRKLSRHIADSGWGIFLRFLEYKCKWYGKTLVKVDKFFPSSKTCSCCGNKYEGLTLAIRSWVCSNCNTKLDRDINAAKNILKEGLQILCTAGLAGS